MTFAAFAAIQNAGNVQVTNANISVAGRDSHVHTHVHFHETQKDLKAIVDAIYNFRKIQQDTLAKATPGTVQWLFVSNYFSAWWNANGKTKILWGSGIPGAGKTILASLVIDEIEHRAADPTSKVCVAYFYLRYSEHSEVTVRQVLEVFVKQSLERHGTLLPLAQEVYARHICEGTRPTEDQLVGLLQQFSAHMSVTFYILDALDEAPVDIQHDLVEKLASLNAQILITSRPLQDVQAYFPEAHCFEIVARDRDLDLLIVKKLQSSPRVRALLDRGEASVKQRVISTVKSKCGGMFLHAALQLDALQKCLNIHSVMQTLERFPSSIEGVYTQTWERILNQDLEHAALAKLALIWVLYAKRPLTIGELCQAIATCPETHRFEQERVVPESTVMDLCYGLLIVDKESQLVRPVHDTAKKTLESFLRISLPNPHALLAAVCIARLTECGFQDAAIDSETELKIALRTYPLLDYAYGAWVFHAQEALDLDFIASRLSTFIGGCHAFPAILNHYHYHHDGIYGYFDMHFHSLRPFHIVACYNLPIALAGPHGAHDPNIRTIQTGETPLHLACFHGHQAAVRDLLCLPDLLISTRDGKGDTALMVAHRHGGDGIVKLLLDHPGIELNAVDGFKRTVLMRACSRGDAVTVRLLIAHPDVKVNLIDQDEDTALTLASCEGHEEVVKLLLGHPDTDVNLAGQYGDTGLSNASREGIEGIVKLLLAHPNIQVNLANNDGDTALLLAASNRRNGSIVKLLLAHPDIEVNLVDEDGDTSLIIASREGYEATVAVLLAHPSTMVNLVNDEETALIAASSWHSNKHIVKLLLSHPNIEVNMAGERGNTALMLASHRGHTDIVKLLLAAPGIDVNRSNVNGDTAIKMAEDKGHGDVVRMLLEVEGIRTSVANTDDYL